jgi:predicted ATPase
MTLWFLGYPNQALTMIRDALTGAHDLDDPFRLVTVLNWSCIVHHLHRDMYTTQTLAETAIALSIEHAFPSRLAVGNIHLGWALAVQGEGVKGISLLQEGLAGWQEMGSKNAQPFLLCRLAEAYYTMRQSHEGLTTLTEALALVSHYDERWYEAELHRLKGELLLSQYSDNQTEAESCFHEAMTIAQTQSAKSWELRAATSLARLWQCQDKRQDAYDLLAPVYGWFTEGFDTADLQEAKSLLEDLA